MHLYLFRINLEHALRIPPTWRVPPEDSFEGEVISFRNSFLSIREDTSGSSSSFVYQQ